LVPLTVAACKAVPPAVAAGALAAALLWAELLADPAGALPAAAELPELPQAVRVRAVAARPATPHSCIFRIRTFPLSSM
jgi:hypothetical protein